MKIVQTETEIISSVCLSLFQSIQWWEEKALPLVNKLTQFLYQLTFRLPDEYERKIINAIIQIILT